MEKETEIEFRDLMMPENLTDFCQMLDSNFKFRTFECMSYGRIKFYMWKPLAQNSKALDPEKAAFFLKWEDLQDINEDFKSERFRAALVPALQALKKG